MRLTAAILLSVLLQFSCRDSAERNVVAADPASTSELALKYARHFEILESDGKRELVVYADPARTVAHRYTLLTAESIAERERLPGEIVVPVSRAVSLSTTHAALFEALNQRDKLYAVSGGRYLYDEELQQRLVDGSLIELGEAGGFDYERLVALEPDLVISFVTDDPAYGIYPKLTSLGLPAVINTEFRETHPLGQAEWIKFLGVLTGQEALATHIFDSIEQRYLSLEKKLADQAGASVFTGMPWKGEWTIPAGESFPAKYLAAAGAAYLWADSEGEGSLFLDLEQMLVKAGDAALWLNPGAADRLEAITANDERLSHFSAFKKGEVYNNVKRRNAHAGNDYWESGVVYPDRVLSDLGAIISNYELSDKSWQDSLWYYVQLQ